MKNIFYDTNGKISSKRVFGGIIIIIGLLGAIGLYVYSLLYGAKDADTATNLVYAAMGTGASLLGVSVFEKGNK